MLRSGRLLELVVKQLEHFLTPEGVKITSPERFYKGNVCIGEVDVTLRGNFGSSKIFLGLECRDRPSDGPQSLAWIRDLHGKREQLKLDKIIAVSSTGFLDSAIELARDLMIDLLTLSEAQLESGDLSKWVKATNIEIQLPAFDFGGDITIISKGAPDKHIDVTPDTAYLRTEPDGSLISPRALVRDEALKMFGDFQRTLRVTENATVVRRGPIEAVVGEQEFIVDEIRIPLKFWRETVKAKMVLNAYSRPDSGAPLALSGLAQIEGRNMKFKILALQKEIEGGKEISVRFLTEEGVPFTPIAQITLSHPAHGVLATMEFVATKEYAEAILQKDCNSELMAKGMAVTCVCAVLVKVARNDFRGHVHLSDGQKLRATILLSNVGASIEVG